jgi:AcrR family transcriptional regulator
MSLSATIPLDLPAGQPAHATRRDAVLETVLRLLVSDGVAVSTATIARAASCSKETLYKWFGDRDGLLTATVQWQAARVAMPVVADGALDRPQLLAALQAFAASWLTVITGEASIALNRAAVAHPASLGQIVLANGPAAMQARLAPLFEAGRAAGLIDYESIPAAFSCFFGLVIGDLQIRLLLGQALRLGPEQIQDRAAQAAGLFLQLHPSIH